MPDRHTRRIGAVSAVAAGSLLLIGCTAQAPEPAEPTPVITVTHAPDPEIVPDGSALQNQPYFDLVNTRLIESGASLDGRAFIDALVAAGYDKADMEVTRDRTVTNLQADSIQFSILLAESTCLIGQWGRDIGYASTVGPMLGTGTCLIGETRPIDW